MRVRKNIDGVDELTDAGQKAESDYWNETIREACSRVKILRLTRNCHLRLRHKHPPIKVGGL